MSGIAKHQLAAVKIDESLTKNAAHTYCRQGLQHAHDGSGDQTKHHRSNKGQPPHDRQLNRARYWSTTGRSWTGGIAIALFTDDIDPSIFLPVRFFDHFEYCDCSDTGYNSIMDMRTRKT